MKLHISKELVVPIDIATEAVAWIGARGSGKTHGAGKLVELLHGEGVPVVVLDPVGVWFGIRLAKDGKNPGLSIPVFGGLRGDVPLEPTAGALIADLLVDKNLSAILDVSQFDTDAQKARFAADFAERLFARKKKDPAVVHFVIDEAQEFVPQNPMPGEQMMLHRFHRLIKLGRNFGIGVSLLTQRPQETSKKVLNQCQTVFAFRLTGPQERKTMRDWIAAHDLDQSLVEQLPGLETGTCHIWSPAFLKVSERIRILPKATYDASATPKFGQRRAAHELAPIEMDELRKAMAATIEKAKAEDPRTLRLQVAELKSLLAHAQAQAARNKPEVYTKEKRVEVPVLKEAQIKRLETALEKARKVQEASLEALLVVTKVLDRFKVSEDQEPKVKTPVKVRIYSSPPQVIGALRPELIISNPSQVSRPQGKILSTLVFLEGIGVRPSDKSQVALFAGVSPRSGSYANNLSALKTAGRIEYPQTGFIALTDQGRADAPNVPVPRTTPDLHAAVVGNVSRPQAVILQHLLGIFPEARPKAEVAEALGIASGSGSYANNLSKLHTMGAIVYPRKGEVRAADIMFIKDGVTA